MTALNNPTPEVERWHFSAPPLGSAKMITRKDGDWLLYEDHLAALQQALINLDIDHVDAISRLTAERDEWMGQAGRLQVHLTDEHERAEAAEKQANELEAMVALTNQRCDAAVESRKRWHEYTVRVIDKYRTANKLLSERVAVLEKELAFADKQTSLIEEVLDPHIKWEPIR